MLYFTIALLSAFLVGLVAASGLRLRGRLRRRLVRSVPVVDDGAVSQILEKGVLAVDEDEPLDQREIDDEERRFWSERWDEPEEL
ncbi:MAG: hypothetical protein Q8N53_17930 [Longimicrobiales bacterium]|nr:hypothetical protein [Longimicrobiales bacterium]